MLLSKCWQGGDMCSVDNVIQYNQLVIDYHHWCMQFTQEPSNVVGTREDNIKKNQPSLVNMALQLQIIT